MFTVVYSPLQGFIWNQHNDQLPVGLLAQLVEHCTGITEIMGSNPVQVWIFFRPYFYYYLSSVHNYEDHFHTNICTILTTGIFFQNRLEHMYCLRSLVMLHGPFKSNFLYLNDHCIYFPISWLQVQAKTLN